MNLKIRIAEAIYNSACKRPFTLWALPGLYGLSIWAEETLREYRSEQRRQQYARLRAKDDS